MSDNRHTLYKTKYKKNCLTKAKFTFVFQEYLSLNSAQHLHQFKCFTGLFYVLKSE